ncbi:MAG: hypothetical protein FWD99_02935 [Oscillospiraceae bacterium]|nr:hypothetical protein [Oscillospiraceae bacterium]
MSLTLELKSKIKDILKQEGQVLGLFVLENIPEKKLQGAKRKYAQEMGNDETAIFLVDSTVMGSGKEGYLLTNKRFYNKPMMEKRTVIDIVDIIDISVVSTNKNKGIAIESFEIKTNSDVIALMEGSPEELIKNEHIPLFYILKRTIFLIKNPSILINEGSDSVERMVTCQCCGAHNNSNICEYCNAPLPNFE